MRVYFFNEQAIAVWTFWDTIRTAYGLPSDIVAMMVDLCEGYEWNIVDAVRSKELYERL